MSKKWLRNGALALSSIAMAAGLAACGGGGGSRTGDYYYDGWYDVYGYYCTSTPQPGCNFYSDGVKIIDVEDPYYYSNYYLQYGSWEYYDSYGFYQQYTGWGWLSPNGILYDDWGNALNETDEQGRDYVADVAELEKTAIKGAGEVFAAKYGLSVEAGIKIAKAMNDWATLGKDRARTQADLEDFTERLYGVDFNKVKNALAEAQEGEKAALEEVVNEAATNWGTTPETMKEIMKTWYGKQTDML